MKTSPKIYASCLLFIVFFSNPSIQIQAQDANPTDLSGFESNELYDVDDETPLTTDESLLIRTLYRATRTSQKSFRQFQQYSEALTPKNLLEEPQESRFYVFQRKAIASKVARVEIPSGSATEGFSHFWMVAANLDGSPVLIASHTVPREWSQMKTLNEPIEFTGFFYGIKSLSQFRNDDQSVPVFVTNRLSWFPGASSETSDSYKLLSKLGVDMGMLDVVRSNHGKSLSSDESEYFYQLMKAAKKTGEDPSLLENAKPVGFLDLLQDPRGMLGQTCEIEGNVRRVIPVPLSRERQALLGIEQFYEMDIFVSLTDLPSIKVTNAAGEKIEYKDRFPVTIHVPELSGPIEEYRHKRIKIQGFYYRFWNFQSEFTKELGAERGQMCPIVIGFAPRIVKSSTRLLDWILTMGTGVFVVALGGLIWYLRRSDQNLTSPLKRLDELPEKIQIDE